MKQSIYIALFLYLVANSGCYREELVFTQDVLQPQTPFQINGVDGFMDLENHRLMFHIPQDSLEKYSVKVTLSGYDSILFNNRSILDKETLDLGPVNTSDNYSLQCYYKTRIDTFTVWFSILPLLRISSGASIVDEPKVPCRIDLQYSISVPHSSSVFQFSSYGGIEIRGARSQKFPKVSYGFELWKNLSGDDYAYGLLGMRYAEDWILDAMYIDDLRIRNNISYKLWNRLTNTHEQNYCPTFPGIHSNYVELFIDNQYMGLYNLSERMDEKLLEMKNPSNEHGAVLYKAVNWSDGATSFDTILSAPGKELYWDGWEQIYPETDTAWAELSRFRELVLETEDEEFRRSISSACYANNLEKLYLFLNLIKASDNTGKNLFLAKYHRDSSFFFIPWDLEASWGISYMPSKIGAKGILTNRLFTRMIETRADNFEANIDSLWYILRQGPFHKDSLLHLIASQYQPLLESKVFEREFLRWKTAESDIDEEYVFIQTWLHNRLEYLDQEFGYSR